MPFSTICECFMSCMMFLTHCST